jgi:hypothetical protein
MQKKELRERGAFQHTRDGNLNKSYKNMWRQDIPPKGIFTNDNGKTRWHCGKQVPYSQHSIFFVTYESAQ